MLERVSILRRRCHRVLFVVPIVAIVALCQSTSGFSPISTQHFPLSQTYSKSAIQSSPSSVMPATSTPLPPHTFGGMVEQRLLEQFDEKEIGRVLTSWRLLEYGYEHKEYMGPTDGDPATSQCHQECHSYVPDLTCREYWDVDDFAWCSKLSKKYKAVASEFAQNMKSEQELAEQGNNVWAGALTDDASAYGVGWKTLVLMNRGVWDPTNVELFPVTARAVRDSGAPVTEVFFASLQANTDIQPHSDFTNFVLTSHFAIDIPESGHNKCRLTIGDEERQWQNGEVSLFDTSLLHSAVNESDSTRYILMMRVWHPDLTEKEIDALQFLYAALENPGLTSQDPYERSRAHVEVENARKFPSLATGFGAKPTKRKTKKKKR